MPVRYAGTGAPLAPVFAAPIASVAVGQIASYLTTGYWRDTGAVPAKFNVAPGGTLTVNLTGLTAEGRTLALMALDSWTQVTGIRFAQVSAGGQITFDDNQSGAHSTSRKSGGVLLSSHVNVSTAWIATYGADPGGYGLQTYIHEIGHALGLGHPGPYNTNASYVRDAIFALDSWQMTIMSYFSQSENRTAGASWAWVLSPQLADIRAMEMLYGVNTQAGAGDTTYGLGANGGLVSQAIGGLMAGGRLADPISVTLYDRSGIDLLDLSSDTRAQVIDLRPAAASTTFGLKGNLVIAPGTVIENLKAGRGSDAVHGNAAANAIWAGAGHDTVEAGDGADRVFGGEGNDALLGGNGDDRLNGESGTDWLSGGAGRDILAGGLSADTLLGGLGHDRLYGEDGADLLEGGFGHDLLWGGTGADLLQGDGGNDSLAGGAEDDLLEGGEGADQLWGEAGNDLLRGDAGEDSLAGGLGDDTLAGGAGLDLLTGGPGADVFVMTPDDGARDRITDFVSGLDRLSLNGLSVEAMIGAQAFSGAAGELRHVVTQTGVLVDYDLDGDGLADISFSLAQARVLLLSDFL